MFKTLNEIEIATLSEKLDDSVSHAVEETTFLSVEDTLAVSDDLNFLETASEYITGNISIKTAPAIYSMELIAAKEFLKNISADIIVPGTDSEGNNNMYIDVILELLNTITGNLMRRMEMLTGPFTIGIPEYKIGNETNDNALIVKKYVVDEKNLIKVAITKIETIPQI